MIFERKQSYSRSRQPRPFYGEKRVIKKYDPQHAYIIGILVHGLEQGEFQMDHFLEIKLVLPHMLLLTEEHLLLIETSQKVLVWHVPTHLIAGATKLKNGLIVELSEKYGHRNYMGLPLDERTIDDYMDDTYNWINTIAASFNP